MIMFIGRLLRTAFLLIIGTILATFAIFGFLGQVGKR